jgi:hypothetical protein
MKPTAYEQEIATRRLRQGLRNDSVRIPHQAWLELVAVVTRVRIGTEPLLAQADARRETEQLGDQFHPHRFTESHRLVLFWRGLFPLACRP